MKFIINHYISAICLSVCLNCAAEMPQPMLPTMPETDAMLKEADYFLSKMPENFQDNQAAAILQAINGDIESLSAVRQSRDKAYSCSEEVNMTEIIGEGNAEGIKMRLFKPKKQGNAILPLLVYFHGGGWVFGSINSCSAFCDALVSKGDVMVLAVDYSLAPEHPFPQGLNDCVAAIEFASSKAENWGSSTNLISLGGDSSGGNLALASALFINLSPLTGIKINSLVLFYPVVKAFADDSDSWKKYGHGYGLDSYIMQAFNKAYIARKDFKDPLISPYFATDKQLSDLPPMLIVNAGRDILCDQGKVFADRAARVERIVFPGAVHLFITVPGQPTAFAKAVILTSEFLKINR